MPRELAISEPFPIPAPPFNGASRCVEVSDAVNWLRQGWAIFNANPGAWMAMMVIIIVINFGLSMIPLLGHLTVCILAPLFAAGMLCACRKVADDETFAISDLFFAISDLCQRNSSALVMLGMLFMLAMLVLGGLLVVLAGGGIASGLLLSGPVGVGIALSAFFLAALVGLLLSAPIAMAIWFAPALVIFNDLPARAALTASFAACRKNIVVFAIYGLVVGILCILAALPAGIGFLVLGPIVAGSVYASYRDIFVAA